MRYFVITLLTVAALTALSFATYAQHRTFQPSPGELINSQQIQTLRSEIMQLRIQLMACRDELEEARKALERCEKGAEASRFLDEQMKNAENMPDESPTASAETVEPDKNPEKKTEEK